MNKLITPLMVITIAVATTGCCRDTCLINGHNFVDLGLPSGLLWAETNIGAEIATDDGEYYAWGEVQTKGYYDRRTYKYATSHQEITNMSKYNYKDNKTILDKEDDAAYVNWGSSCRIPTKGEFGELLDSCNCDWKWISITISSGSSKEGYQVTSKKNGNSIFLPASGYRLDDSLSSGGNYWSATLYDCFNGGAFNINFRSNYTLLSARNCELGLSIRPVAERKDAH